MIFKGNETIENSNHYIIGLISSISLFLILILFIAFLCLKTDIKAAMDTSNIVTPRTICIKSGGEYNQLRDGYLCVKEGLIIDMN